MASNEAEIETKEEILMALAYQFSTKGTEVFSIGDAKEPRNALTAIQEGFMLGRKI